MQRAMIAGLAILFGASALAQTATDPPAAPPAAPPPLPAPPTPPPLPPVAPEISFFVAEGGVQPTAPMTLEQIRARIQAKAITRKTLVWKAGMAGWAEAGSVPEFAALFPPEVVDNNKAAEDYLVGVWEVQSSLPQLNAQQRTVARYTADKRFQGQTSTQFAPMQGMSSPPSVVTFSGVWNVTGIDDRHFTLTLRPDQGYMVSVNLTIIDQQTMRNEGENSIVRRIGR